MSTRIADHWPVPPNLWLRVALAVSVATLMFAAATTASGFEVASPEQIQFFELKIRPLLVERCYRCHSAEKRSGGLRLDSRTLMLAGGDSGPALVPGQAAKSLLVEAVRYESLEMPPKGKLPDDEIELLVRWVDMGAPWPGDDKAARGPLDRFTDEDRAWWAIQPIASAKVPEAGDGWAQNPVDRFIARDLAAHQLTPAPEADRRVLVRRLFYDLTGLPPSPGDIARFESDSSPEAYESLVDRLLASPEYGERSARQWLDLVRYADSDGYRIDHYRPDAWRYRDYVIQSLNDDKPYDRFAQEQLAGDELFPGDPNALIATGFLRQGIYEYNARDVRGQWDIMQNELTDATADVFLGLGLQCAKCHDHKFDPLLQTDYYRLRAFFEPVLPQDRVVASPEEIARHEADLARFAAATADIQRQLDELEEPYRLKACQQAIGRFPDDIQAMIRTPEARRRPLEHQLAELAYRQVDFEYGRLDQRFTPDDRDRILALRKELVAFNELKPKPLATAMAVGDAPQGIPPTTVPKKKIEVTPGFPALLNLNDPSCQATTGEPRSTGRRAALARWITSPDNPLTARVLVNRIWQQHFGRGLAPNGSDFGRLGGPPSHPELLDWLAREFMRGDWRLKPLHKLMVMSATYRQSTHHPRFDEFQTVDPANGWYWRSDTRRLQAEQIRDTLLAVSGQLDPARGGPGVLPDEPRRTIYTRVMRNARDPLLDAFDLPQFISSTSSRNSTTTPIQSLLLINGQSLVRRAALLADRVRQQTSNRDATPEALVLKAWELAYGRDPTSEELRDAVSYLTSQSTDGGATALAATSRVRTGNLPYRNGQALMIAADDASMSLKVPMSSARHGAAFTMEAYFQLRSVSPTGALRTIASTWNGKREDEGWTFGITGLGSRRKAQTLALVVMTKGKSGKAEELALFSDQHIDVGKPYYAAVSFQPASESAGTASFFLKDLSDDDEPLQTRQVEHLRPVAELPFGPLAIGARLRGDSRFDGLIDDVRLSSGALDLPLLLLSLEGQGRSSVGYWRFEPDPGVFKDSSSQGHHIDETAMIRQDENRRDALTSLCHVLLNSSEFLYVD